MKIPMRWPWFNRRKSQVRDVAIAKYADDRVADAEFRDQEYVHHRYHNRTFERCQFERCKFDDLRMWQSSFVDTVFQRCSLSGGLGGIQDGKANRFYGVVFADTDLRGTSWSSAEMINCRFENCRLDQLDFQGTRFTGCSFVGELDDVLFYDAGFNEPDQPKNEMRGCDFSRARMTRVGFRRLNLETVIPPLPEYGVTITNYLQFLRIAAAAAKPEEQVFKKMMEHYLKWAGPRQYQGFFGRNQMRDLLGSEWEARIAELQAAANEHVRKLT